MLAILPVLLLVVIFTSSKQEADVRKSYQMGANSYLLKPLVFEELVEMVKEIYHYWFCLNNACLMTNQ